MKSLIQHIYELKDETYLNLARKRNAISASFVNFFTVNNYSFHIYRYII